MANTLPGKVVKYDGTNYGRVYLRDVGARNGLGGGKGIYNLGQDRYLNHGQDATLVQTGEVALSAKKGVISKMTAKGAFTVSDAVITL
jgi:transketolase C-terminal domain/subunit